MIERIVVGVDGSANARAALDWAAALAEGVQAEVLAVHGVGLRERAALHGDGRDEAWLRAQFDDVWCAPLANRAIRRRRLLLDGDPVSVLLRTIRDEHADLLVVGCRGVGERPELLLGSTSAQVTQRSPVPVVVIPPPVA
jgi:nucleotide-binding universal stress UspA family protein